jgi:hypothetical protein
MTKRSVSLVLALLAMLVSASPMWAADVVVQLFVSRNKGPWTLEREFKGESDPGSNKSAALLASCKAVAQKIARDGTGAGCRELTYEWKIRVPYRVPQAGGQESVTWVPEPRVYADREKCAKALGLTPSEPDASKMNGSSRTSVQPTRNAALSAECHAELVPAR